MALMDAISPQEGNEDDRPPAPADPGGMLRGPRAELLPGEAQAVASGIMGATEAPEQNEQVIATALDRYYRGREAMEGWARIGKECTDFVEGRQWSDKDRQDMIDAGRPVVTLNKIGAQMRFLSGHFRQNRWEVRYLPGQDGTGIQPVAEAMTQLVKSIDERNSSPWNDAEVFRDGTIAGRGYWDYRLDFTANSLGDVKESVLDPFSVILDPEAESYDPEEWPWAMYTRWMSPQDIEALYGQETASLVWRHGIYGSMAVTGEYEDEHVSPSRFYGMEQEFIRELGSRGLGAYTSVGTSAWDYLHVRRRLIRIAEIQHRMYRRGAYFVDLETGDLKKVPDHWRREQIERIVQWSRANDIPLDVEERTEKQLRWTVIAGDRLLYDDWSPYQSMTIIPYFPYHRRGRTRGAVEDLLDPQREINKRRSVMLHIITTMANSGWIYGEDSLRPEVKKMLQNHGAVPGLNVEFRAGKGPPRRIEPGAPPVAYERAERAATDDLKEISSINDSALGLQEGGAASGRAIIARQKSAIVGVEEYFDNFARSRKIKGRKMLEMIQNFYTEERTIRTLGENGDMVKVYINTHLPSGKILNNVAIGKYEIEVDEAPMSSSFQNAQFDAAMEMVNAGLPVPPEVVVDLSPIPRKDEIKARIKLEEQNRAAMGVPPEGPPQTGGRPPQGLQGATASRPAPDLALARNER